VNPPRQKGPSQGLATLLIILLCLIWGSTWLVIKKGNNHLPPLGAAALRFWLAFLAMAFLAPRGHVQDQPPQ